MKNIAVCDGFIGLEPGCYSMGVSRPELTASGNPLLLNSAEAPLTSFTLYGWSKQDGTPSPDNPVPIVSAGDEGEINVTVQGGNLLDSSEMEIGGLSGSSGKDFGATNRIKTGFIPVSSGKIYTLSGYLPYNIANSHIFQADKKTRIDSFLSGAAVPENGAWVRISFSKADQGDFTEEELEALKNTLVFNIGSTPLPYEPYKPLQTLTVQTPNGLPGIPVDASKLPEGMEPTYVDESGQTWVCDEVDFEKGVYVRRVWKATFDGSENWSHYGIAEATSNYGFLLSGALPEPMSYRNGFTNQLEVIENSPSESDRNKFRFGTRTGNTIVYALHVDQYDPSLEDSGLSNWKAHLAAHPLEVMTYLTTATEEPLTAEEIAAYKAMHTYSPTTTVSNDAEAWMKVGYYGLTAIQKLEKEALLINGGKSK